MESKKEKYSRRQFIQKSATGAAALSFTGLAATNVAQAGTLKENKIPQRTLGKTGLNVSLLSFGGGSQFLKNGDGDWEKSLETAIKSGINLFDTAPSYTLSGFNMGTSKTLGTSEARFGQVLSPYRKQIILSTKVESRNPDLMKEELEVSLKSMKTDYIDILMIHAIAPSDNVSEIEKGVYKELIKLKEAGTIRFIGFSSMDSAERSRDLLENLDFDVALLAMNATQYGNYAKIALPVARKKNVGVIAMKVMRNLVGEDATAEELFEYAWTQEGVASAVVGHYGMKPLKENIKLARKFIKSGQASIRRTELENRMSKYANPDTFCWAQPGYQDGGIIV